ncbi:unnamed protein product [Phaedon cochleariae]|uniref:Zinc finger protein n=1 Tax=Phaedon cochleariae TaxID=80249 RepID=A0A9P0DRX2_PHACE|nr:unnamed protein product [Phaedon cochleariae]
MEDRSTILSQMKICRFCFSENESELSSIHGKVFLDGDTRCIPLPLQIMACVAIEVFNNDGMPQMICKTCRNLTMKAYTFKLNCKKVDDAFKLFIATGQLSKPYIDAVTEMNVPRQEKTHINEMVRKIQAHKDAFEDNTNLNTIENEIEIHVSKNIEQVELDEQEYEEGIRGDEDEEYTLVDLDSINKNKEKVAEEEPIKNCFSCPHCSKSFRLKQLLDLHITNHDRERSFECELCSRKFFNKYDLQKHEDSHNPEKNHICVVCNKSFSRYALLARHEKVHSDAPRYACTVSQCDKTFLTKEYLNAHLENHTKKRPYTCKICSKSFVFKQGLERHEVSHQASKPHKCNYCEASFTSSIKLARHITSHAGLRPYPCKQCGRTFLLSHHLTRHMRSHFASKTSSPESLIGLYKCDICSMSFRRKDSLINHSAIHSMVNLRCVICNTVFETANMVKEHITTHLTGLPFPCEKCDYSFESADQLEEHELKHAEMEYEDQIEKEVISEAHRKGGQKNVGSAADDDEEDDEELDAVEEDEEQFEGEDEYENEDVRQYTITDIDNSEIIPTSQLVQQQQQQQQRQNQVQQVEMKRQQQQHIQKGVQEESNEEHFEMDYMKNEIHSEEEMEMHEPENDNAEYADQVVQQQPLKPIVRQEGTKMYQGRATERRPHIVNEEISVRQSSLTIPETPIEIDAATTLQSTVNRKIGDKVVKVQKFILTKDEMKAMAKQGILRMKGGQVVLKSPGQAILNATLKPVHKNDIESLLDLKAANKAPVRRYRKRKEATIFSEEDLTSNPMDM